MNVLALGLIVAAVAAQNPPPGERIETITAPEVPANVVFGGKGMQTLFMTARTGFYAVKTRVQGVGPQ